MSNPITYTRINEDFLDVHQSSDYLNTDDIIYEDVRAEIKKIQEDRNYKSSIDFCNLPDAYYKPDDHQELWNIVRIIPSSCGQECNLNWIDVSGMRDLSYIFEGNVFNGSIFNGDISRWDVSQAVRMSCMFANSVFNKDISKWNVSNVRYMNKMFFESSFNQDISDWDVRQVKTMKDMFMKSRFKKAALLNKWNDKIKINCDTDNMFTGAPKVDDYGNLIRFPSFYDDYEK